MAIEIYKSSRAYSATYFDYMAFDLATMFSGSSHINIIDSYSPNSSPNRYKGDPIADNIWTNRTDCSKDNCWIVIECITTRHSSLELSNWQMKFRWQASLPGLEDVSDPTGVTYPKNHHNRLYMYCRFSAYGGWDLADSTPDFNPVGGPSSPSTQNHRVLLHTSPDDSRWYLVCDDGCISMFSRKNSSDFRIFGIGCYAGDVDPVKAEFMPMPRAFFGSGSGAVIYTVGNSQWLAEQNNTSCLVDYSTTESGVGMCFYDNNLNLIEEGFRVPTGWYALGRYGETQPNMYHPTTYPMDLFPFMPMPKTTKGLWFAVPLIRKGWGVGHSIIENKTWLSGHSEYCLYIKWDGSTDVFE